MQTVGIKVRDLADFLGATYEGDGERLLTGVAPLDSAGSAELSFVGNRKAIDAALKSAAGCLIVAPDFVSEGRALIRVPDPRTGFARAIARMIPKASEPTGVHPTAVVGSGVEIGEGASVGPNAVIGGDSKIGAGARIGAGSVISRRVTIGADTVLRANVTIYEDCDIGARCVLHAGCVIGADGFGFVMAGDHYEKFPQVGRVLIGDDCEIGANSCVDRAALGVTWIGEGTKLDNMVHIGHNCRIGRHVVIAAQTGFSGGVVVEDYAVIGGQVGIGDKARIESRAVLGSGCGVLTSKIIRGGQVVWGTPARPLKEHLEQLANLARLPHLRREIEELKAKVRELSA